MIYLILSLIVLIYVTKRIVNIETYYEALLLSLALLFGLSGFAPFIANEMFNISYNNAPLLILTVVVGVGAISLLAKIKNKNNLIISRDWLFIFVMMFSVLILIRGYLLPIRGWDTFSLYDSRAKIFTQDIKLAEMKLYSKYDEYNQLYYFSYPPMTSVLHTVMYVAGSNRIMFVYALFYVIFIGFVYLAVDTLKIEKKIKFLIYIISALNPLIFTHTKIAYTNLPAITFQFVSLFYLIRYSKTGSIRLLFISALFIGFANWTRSLEPVFLSFFAAFVYLIYIEKIKLIQKIFRIIIYFSVSMVTWVIWKYYISVTIGGLGDTSPGGIQMIGSLYNSLMLANLIDVVFFLFKSLFPVILYFILAITSFIFIVQKGLNKIGYTEKIISIIIIVTNLLMVAGTLYFSVTFSWWNQIPDSYLRSNLIMLPLMGILTGYIIQQITLKRRNT